MRVGLRSGDVGEALAGDGEGALVDAGDAGADAHGEGRLLVHERHLMEDLQSRRCETWSRERGGAAPLVFGS